MIGATVMFAISNALSKWVVAIYPVGEVMFSRSLIVADRLLGLHASGDRLVGVCHQTGCAITLPGAVASGLADVHGHCLQHDAACRRHRDQFLGAAVFRTDLRALAEGARRSGALGHSARGFVGVLIVVKPGADSFQLGALFALANAVMYGSVTVAVRGMSKTKSANTLLMWQMVTLAVLHSVSARLRISLADAAARRASRLERRRQRRGAISMDEGAACGAGHGGVAVLLFPVGLDAVHWILRLGRRADDQSARRIGHRRRFGAILALSGSPSRNGGAGGHEGPADATGRTKRRKSTRPRSAHECERTFTPPSAFTFAGRATISTISSKGTGLPNR